MRKTLITLLIVLLATNAFAAKTGIQETIEANKQTMALIEGTLAYVNSYCYHNADKRDPKSWVAAININDIIVKKMPGLGNFSCIDYTGTIDRGTIKTEVNNHKVQSAIIYDGSITTSIYPDYYFITRKMVFADQYYVTFKFNNQTYDWTVNDARLPFTAGNDTILMADKSFKLTNNLTLNNLIHDYYAVVEQTEAMIDKNGVKRRVSIPSYVGWLLSDREFQNKFIDYVQLNTMPKNARDKVLKQRQEDTEKARLEALKKKYGVK